MANLTYLFKPLLVALGGALRCHRTASPGTGSALADRPKLVNETMNLSGSAEFANGIAKFVAALRFESDAALLVSLKITSKEETWSFPVELSRR